MYKNNPFHSSLKPTKMYRVIYFIFLLSKYNVIFTICIDIR